MLLLLKLSTCPHHTQTKPYVCCMCCGFVGLVCVVCVCVCVVHTHAHARAHVHANAHTTRTLTHTRTHDTQTTTNNKNKQQRTWCVCGVLCCARASARAAHARVCVRECVLMLHTHTRTKRANFPIKHSSALYTCNTLAPPQHPARASHVRSVPVTAMLQSAPQACSCRDAAAGCARIAARIGA